MATGDLALELHRRSALEIRAVTLVCGIGAAAAAAAAWAAAHSAVLVDPGNAALWIGLVVASYWGVGTYTWLRRPDSRLGPLVAGIGLLYAAAVLASSAIPLVHTLGMVVWAAGVVASAYLYLCFPSGRLESSRDRSFMLVLTVSATVVWVLILALSPTLPAGGVLVNCGVHCPPNALQTVSGNQATGAALATASRILFTAAAAGLAFLILQKVRSSTDLRRRAITPLAGVFVANAAIFVIALSLAPTRTGVAASLVTARGLLAAAVPFAILAGQIRGEVFAAIRLGEVAVRANGKPLTPAAVEELLGDALGDASLRLVLWIPEHSHYVDTGGEPVALPAETSLRGVTRFTHNGRPAAALIHDPSLNMRANVVRGLAATSLMLLENARLVQELRASRSRIVHAAERERQRLERDLHDGAQQHLVALELRLDSARELAGNAELVRRLDAAQRDAEATLEEIRALAHGIYPADLHQFGPVSAIRALALRWPIPIRVLGQGAERYPEAIEAAIYFCAREAIQNAAKHAGPGANVTVAIWRRKRAVEFSVTDDGIGLQAAPNQDGVGITGMRDRIEAVGGELEIASAPGHGTSVQATIPLSGSPRLAGVTPAGSDALMLERRLDLVTPGQRAAQRLE